MQPNKPKLRALMPALLTMLLAGCASESQTYLRSDPPAIPPLPAAARQPMTTVSPCLPSCSAALTNERERWLKMSMPRESQELPARPPTKVSPSNSAAGMVDTLGR